MFHSCHILYDKKKIMSFHHSVKVPTQYKKTAAALKAALEQKKSLKQLILDEKHAQKRSMQAVLKSYIDNRGAVDDAIEKSKILEENPRLCSALCKVLVTELIFGRKQLNGESKPVTTVRDYRDRLLEALGGEINVTPKKKDTKPRYVRVNTNLLSVAEALEMLASENWRLKEHPPFESYNDFLQTVAALEEDEFLIDMHLDTVLIFHSKQRHYWACHQYVEEKKFLLQDKATCLVADLLNPPPDSVVLDMCAAPGMKTMQLCNIMRNKGKIYAIEMSNDRYRTLSSMIRAGGCDIVETINADALTIDNTQCPDVEYILVDPSCSGSGMQNRMSLEPEKKDADRLNKLAGLQIKMLLHAMNDFPNAKRIAYSTCSLYEEENEQVVERCLQRCANFKLLSGKKALRNKWQNTGSPNYKKIGKHCLYSRPEHDLTDGIFIAIFERIREDDGDKE